MKTAYLDIYEKARGEFRVTIWVRSEAGQAASVHNGGVHPSQAAAVVAGAGYAQGLGAEWVTTTEGEMP